MLMFYGQGSVALIGGEGEAVLKECYRDSSGGQLFGYTLMLLYILCSPRAAVKDFEDRSLSAYTLLLSLGICLRRLTDPWTKTSNGADGSLTCHS